MIILCRSRAIRSSLSASAGDLDLPAQGGTEWQAVTGADVAGRDAGMRTRYGRVIVRDKGPAPAGP
ncbi:hypothetical protein FAIPA1_80009 [Frankia sp. AiPs1]